MMQPMQPMQTAKVVVIEDDYLSQQAICSLLDEHDMDTLAFSNPEEGLDYIASHSDFQAVITDVHMKQLSGLEVLEKINQMKPKIPVILITGFGEIKMVIDALRAGAYDFIQKPFENQYLLASVNRAIEKVWLQEENVHLSKRVTEQEEKIRSLKKYTEILKNKEHAFHGIIGKSVSMRAIFELIERTADTQANVLIFGETGTGKEMIANAIHACSARRENRLVAINCGALPENLIESELFGYEPGAFTGADTRRIGKFEYAQGGTLFLDEIGELSLSLQVKLLRVLQERSITRLGGNKPIKVDARVIAATNRDLANMVEQGNFRKDLYYRLHVIPIQIPPLRERKEDILLLSMHFINKFNAYYTKNITGISESLNSYLMRHPWEGNVRELENVIERLVVLAQSDILDYRVETHASMNPLETKPVVAAVHTSLKQNVELFEKTIIQDVLTKTKGSMQQTAEKLDIDVKTLYRKMKRYRIQREQFKNSE